MEFVKLVKNCTPPRELTKAEKKDIEKDKSYDRNYYLAHIENKVLIVDIFGRDRFNKAEYRYRHFFDGKDFKTLRISDNGKLTSKINAYAWYFKAIDEASEKAVIDYVKGKKTTSYWWSAIDKLVNLECEIEADRRERRDNKIWDATDEELKNVPDEIPAEFKKWTETELFAELRRFFYKYKRGKSQEGFCSFCKKSFRAKTKNGEKLICPKCKSELTAVSIGKLRVGMIHSCFKYAAYLQPVGDTLLERVFVVEFWQEKYSSNKEYRERVILSEYERTFLDPITLEPLKKYYYSVFRGYGPQRWNREKDTHSAHNYEHEAWVYPYNLAEICRSVCGNADIEYAAKVLPMRVEYFAARLKKYPVVEALVKIGLIKLVKENVPKWKGEYNTELWRMIKSYTGRNAAGLLGVNRDAVRELAQKDISSDEYFIFIAFKGKAVLLSRAVEMNITKYPETIAALCGYGISGERMLNYLEKQTRSLNRRAIDIIGIWRDTLDMDEQLKIPFTESVLFPKDVQKEHDRLAKIQFNEENKDAEKKLKKRMEILKPLSFTDGKFIIEPLRTPNDFYNESAVLSHCVKTYVKRCAEGETNIFGIRKAEAPKTPYFTLTLNNQAEVTMNLGKNNCSAPDDVKKFVKKWLSKVVAPRKEEFIAAADPQNNDVRVRVAV